LRVTVAFFAAMRDAAGTPEESVELPDGTTVDGLLQELHRVHPTLRALADDTLVSVNRGLGAVTTVLRDGDAVALFPPLAGG
jgi:molybdopterin synthase sulfur carrier subunit